MPTETISPIDRHDEKITVLEPPGDKLKNKEAQKINKEALERLERDLDVDRALKNLESNEELTSEQRKMLKGILENRRWQKLFTNLHPGDHLLSFLDPSDENFAIKNLNDNIFGQQITDNIIAKRRQLIQEKIKKTGFLELAQTYKDGFIKISGEYNKKVFKNIQSIIQETSTEITTYIKNLLIEEIKRNPDFHPDKREKFREALEKGYRLTFGVAQVGQKNNENDYSHIEEAISESLKAAMISRQSQENGQEYNEEKITKHLEEIEELRKELQQKQITDIGGRTYDIFTQNGEYDDLNIDIVRDVRKGKFEVPLEHQETLNLIKKFLKMINILDVVKPYTHKELAGEKMYGSQKTIQEQVELYDKLISKLEQDTHELSPEEKSKLAEIVKSEAKDLNCTSAIEFHRKALEIDDCVYLSLDVLDVGPKLLQEFNHLLQDVKNGKKSFREASLEAGDNTTNQMREFRQIIAKTYQEISGTNEIPLMQVGGDEATIAFKSGVDIRKLLLALSRATNARVIETVIGQSERSDENYTGSEEEKQLMKKENHLVALKDAEIAADQAKEIESIIRNIRLSINKQYYDRLNQLISDKKLKVFALANIKGNIVLIREGTAPEEYNEIDIGKAKEELDEIKKRILLEIVGETGK